MNTNDVLRELKDWSVTQPRNSPDVWTATTTPNSNRKHSDFRQPQTNLH